MRVSNVSCLDWSAEPADLLINAAGALAAWVAVLAWRSLARRYRRKLVHIPLSRFSQATIQQLRMFHVLNGQQIRSFAAHFIRKA